MLRIQLARAAWNAGQGRIEPAVDLYLGVASTEDGGLIELGSDEPGTLVRASILASQSLRQLAAAQPQAVRPLLDAKGDLALRTAQADGHIEPLVLMKRLLGVAGAFSDTRTGMAATMAAARTARAAGQMERAELILEPLLHSDQKPVAAAALAALAGIYQDAAQDAAGGPADKAYLADVFRQEAARQWQRMRTSFAGVMLPVGPGQVDAAQLAATSLAALPAEARETAGGVRRLGEPPWRKLWGDAGTSFFLIDAQKSWERQSAFLDSHALVYAQGRNALDCRYLYEPTRIWSISLPQTGGGTQSGDGKVFMANGVAFPGGRIMRDGHMGLIWTDKEVSGYGLIGGKRLWSSSDVPSASDAGADDSSADATNEMKFRARGVRFGGEDPSQLTSFAGGFSLDGSGVAHMSAGYGIVAQHVMDAQKSADMVRVLDSATGAVLWTRVFDRQMVDGLAVTEAGVAVIASGGKDVTALDRTTGRKLGQFAIADRKPELPMVWFEGSLIYQNGSELVRRALPQGKMLFSKIPLIGAANRVMVIDSRRLAVVDNNNQRLRVLDWEAPSREWIKPGDATMRQFRDLAVSADAKEITLVGTNDRNEPSLMVLETGSGKLVGRVPFGAQANYIMAAASFADCDKLIPCAVSDVPPGNGRTSNLYQINFYRLDVKSGDQRDPAAKLPAPRSDGKFEGIDQPPRVQGGVIIIMGQGGITAFGSGSMVKATTNPSVRTSGELRADRP